jgi:truncated hemoglobin YjbI
MIKSTFEQLGGHKILRDVSKVFYDKVYEDKWIGKFFQHVEQDKIEEQQVDFMAQNLGGPKNYCGRLPKPTHQNMMISEELFELRQKYLVEALNEVGASEELKERWLMIDEAFKNVIVKKSSNDCVRRFATDDILDFKKVG